MFLVAAIASLAIPASAQAATCGPDIFGPNDPDFAPGERDPASGKTFNAENWLLFDCIPQSTPLAQDPEGAAGMSVNRAWKDYGKGNPQVVIAYMEGGVNWRRESSRDLRRKAYLNIGELPRPEDASGNVSGASYDLDGDGVVTVDDYKDDPRIKRPFLHEKTAGGITPEDLIVAFSNKRDEDGNGYVDDISGWNFHRDTNDPQTDQSIYNHANGESNVAVGEGDNNFGGVGVCPNCRLLSVKMGDEAIDRPDRVAEAIVFAVDAGAKVIDVTSASLGQTPSMQQAVEYAYRRGVVIAWASNDFESSDHTEGMRFAHVWPGNSVVADQSNRMGQSTPTDATTTTFRSRSTLTSYGSHALFSVPTPDGSTSHAIPTTAGVAAMVSSAGYDMKDPLTANEIFQVTRATSSPIDATPCPTCFPALAGAEWNIQYGYGRPNVWKAMKAVHEGAIPPIADVTGPAWYFQADPERLRKLQVSADVGAPRAAGSFNWEIQYGLGPQPLDDQFKTFASGSASEHKTVRGDLDLGAIPKDFWSGGYDAPTADRLAIERYDVTIRVRVTDAQGRLGEDRRVVYVRHDDSEIQGFHRDLHTSIESSPTLADLEGKGRLDTILAGSDGTVHVLRPNGSEAPGWPQRTRVARGLDAKHTPNYLRSPAWKSKEVRLPREPIVAPAAVGDLDHDGGLDVVVTGTDGHVYVWDSRGRLRKGFPVATSRAYETQSVPPPDTPYVRNRSTGNVGGAALGDLNGDGRLEIVIGGWDGYVYAWQRNGRMLPGWPVKTDTPESARKPSGTDIYARDYKVATTPTLVDVDGDKRPDVIVALQDTAFGSNGSPVYGYVMGFHSDGNRHQGGAVLPGMPLYLNAAAQGYGTAQDFITEGVQTPVAYTKDGTPRLVANAGLFLAKSFDLTNGHNFATESPATLPAESAVNPSSVLIHFTTSASVGRVGGGPLTAVQSGSASTDVVTGVVATPGLGIRVRSGMAAWDPETGANQPKFTQPIQGLAFLSAPALADVTGDGKADVVQNADSEAVHGWDGTSGAIAKGWPKWSGGWTLFTPAIGDLDGDGKVEVVTGTREGWVHAWKTPGLASGNGEAWHWHLNDRNTGHYGDDTRPPAGIRGVKIRRSAKRVKISFLAPGDDWNDGTAASYEVLTLRRPLTQAPARAARRIKVRLTPAKPGTRQSVTVKRPRGVRYFAIRAIDDAGNIGPISAR